MQSLSQRGLGLQGQRRGWVGRKAQSFSDRMEELLPSMGKAWVLSPTPKGNIMTSVPPQAIRDTDQILQDHLQLSTCRHPSCYLFTGRGGNRGKKRKLLNHRQMTKLKRTEPSKLHARPTHR